MAGWSAIIGGVRANKSGYAWRIGRALAHRGFTVGGFVQEPVRDNDGTILGWDIVRLLDGETCPLARISHEPHLCSYSFDEAAFHTAAGWVSEPELDVVVVDGVGKLEAAGTGHYPALSSRVLAPDAPHVIACIRDTSLATIVLGLPDPIASLEVPASAELTQRFVDELDDLLRPDAPSVRPHAALHRAG